ncbi:MAG: Ig-like domain-containing protein [Gemmatimonadaceae bacterium]
MKSIVVGLVCASLMLAGCGGDSPTKGGVVPDETRTLTVLMSGNGQGRVVSTPSGIDCTVGACSASFKKGVTVLLTPSTTGLHTFSTWNGACTGTGACAFTLNDSTTVGAQFLRPKVASIRVTPALTSIAVGDSTTFTAVALASDGSVLADRVITWSSSRPLQATVSTTGRVNAEEAGDTVRIAATTPSDVAFEAPTTNYAELYVIPPVVTIEATDPIASEVANDWGTFTVTRTGATTRPLAVSIIMAGTALNGDYELDTFSPLIPAGQRTAKFNVIPKFDYRVEGPETAVATLPPNKKYNGVGTATVTIQDVTPVLVMQTGVTYTDSITKPGEGKVYAFAADQMAISIADTLGASLSPSLQLYSIQALQLVQSVGRDAAHVQQSSAFSGVQGVVVSSGDSAHTGTGVYQITFSAKATDSLSNAASGDEGGLIQFGIPRTGKLYAGDLDSYTLVVTDQTTVTLSATKTAPLTSSLVPRIYLFGRDNNFSLHVQEPANYTLVLIPGVYTVAIGSGDPAFAGSGSYELLVTRPPM